MFRLYLERLGHLEGLLVLLLLMFLMNLNFHWFHLNH
jgi:hypothetical protein